MDDIAWLNARTVIVPPDHLAADEVRVLLIDAHAAGVRTAAVVPVHLSLVPEGMTRIARVAHPLGRAHTLIKAAEARLAVEYGAEEIWLAADDTVRDENAQLAEIVAVRQAVPQPVRLTVVTEVEATRKAAVTAGADHVLGRDVVWVATLEEAVEALDSGAERLATARPFQTSA